MADQEREIQRVISYIRSCRDAGIDTTITIDKNRNHFILNALEEIQQYRAIGTVEECREARERQRAKKPFIQRTDEKILYKCPCCKNVFVEAYENSQRGYIPKYCEMCGQSIDF